MDEAKDVRIWNHITKNGLALVTKDEDFLHLASRPGETGKLLWVRIGNCRKQVLLRSFQWELPRIVRAFGEGQADCGDSLAVHSGSGSRFYITARPGTCKPMGPAE